jgi:arsenate reductase-like glutaredoxin family protein
MSCKKAQGYLDSNAFEVAEREDAGKQRRGREEALALAKTVDQVVVGRGKKVVTFDMKNDPPDDDILVAHLLGPTGNLKAPTLRLGRKLLVGFSEEAYKQILDK